MPRRQRFLFEGSLEIRGQLWYAERKVLYEAVLTRRPAVAFETGTWEGGGSTFFIASALAEVGAGVLHTVEIDRSRHETAVHGYEEHLPHLASHVRFHLGDSLAVVPGLLLEEGRCDLLFLDGAQDAQQTLAELEMFTGYLRKGSVLVAHDWDNEKMDLVRPLVESDARFRVLRRLSAPASVGMVVAEVVGEPGP